MKKITLIFYFLLFNFSLSQTFPKIDEETIYNYILYAFKGLSISNESQCLNTYLHYKNEIINIIKEMIQELNNGKDIRNLVFPFGMKFFGTGDIISQCQLLLFLDIYNRISSKDGIKGLGYTIYNNAETLSLLGNEIKEVEGFDNKFKLLGRIIKVIFDIYVK